MPPDLPERRDPPERLDPPEKLDPSERSDSRERSGTPAVPSEVDTEGLRRHYTRRLVSGAIVLLILAVPAFVHSAAAIGTLRNIPANWLPDSLELKRDFIEFVERFGVTDVVLVSWPNCKLDDDSLRRVEAAMNTLCRPEQESDQKSDQELKSDWQQESEANWRSDSQRRYGTPEPLDWVRSGTTLRDALMRSPLNLSARAATVRLRGTVVGNDGKQTCLLVSMSPRVTNQHRDFLPWMRELVARTAGVAAEDIAMVGGPVDGAEVDGEAIRSIARYSLPSSLIAAILGWICLRSIPLTAVVLGVATVGQGMVLALVYYTGRPMNAVLIVLPPLVFVLTVSAGIHLSNYFLDLAREQNRDVALLARDAMRMGTRPCIIASLTTVIGLASLLLVRLRPVQTFGAMAAIGVMMTLALLIWMLPGAMCRVHVVKLRLASEGPRDGGVKGDQPGAGTKRAGTKRVGNWIRPLPILGLAALVTCTAALGIGRLRSSVSVPAMFDPDSPLRTQYRWFESNVGATMSGDLLVRFPKVDHEPADSGDLALDELNVLAKLHAALRRLDCVGGVQSALSFLPTPPRGEGLAAAGRRSVLKRQLLKPDGDLVTLGFLDNSDQGRVWRIHLRLYQSERTAKNSASLRDSTNLRDSVAVNEAGGDFAAAIDDALVCARRVVADLEATAGSPGVRPTLALTGHVVIVQRSQEWLLRDLFRSFLAAFVVIALLMMLTLRHVRGGMLTMIPNVLPTLILFGLMGWLSRPLDIGSVMTASLALGIAIDDTVHLLMRYREVRRHSNDRHSHDRRAAAGKAVQQCGRAMLQTTIVCGVSLLAYGFSDFVPTRQFAFFMLGLLAIAWVSVATVLPAIMATPWGDWLSSGQPEGRMKPV
ncbi:MAG: MMPL family transporter [Planctomycetota bacterium]